MIVATSDFEGYFKVKLEPESDYDIICRKIGCFAKTNEVSTVGLRYSTDLYADFEILLAIYIGHDANLSGGASQV